MAPKWQIVVEINGSLNNTGEAAKSAGTVIEPKLNH